MCLAFVVSHTLERRAVGLLLVSSFVGCNHPLFSLIYIGTEKVSHPPRGGDLDV